MQHLRRFLLAAVLMAAMGFTIVMARPAPCVVDGQETNLQAAIIAATDGTTLLLGPSAHCSEPVNGAIGTIQKNLTIAGDPAAPATIQGSANVRGLEISRPTGGMTPSVTLKNLNIQGGDLLAGNGNGAGLYISRANVTLQNINLTNNKATFGGALMADNSTVTGTYVRTDGNTAQSGAGVFAYMSNVRFLNAYAISNYGTQGAADAAAFRATRDSSIRIENGIIAQNPTGILLDDPLSDVYLRHVTIADNYVAGIKNLNHEVRMYASIIARNNVGLHNDGRAYISTNLWSGNGTNETGSGIYGRDHDLYGAVNFLPGSYQIGFNSAACNAGDGYWRIPTDIRGLPRDAFNDLGAIEGCIKQYLTGVEKAPAP